MWERSDRDSFTPPKQRGKRAACRTGLELIYIISAAAIHTKTWCSTESLRSTLCYSSHPWLVSELLPPPLFSSSLNTLLMCLLHVAVRDSVNPSRPDPAVTWTALRGRAVTPLVIWHWDIFSMTQGNGLTQINHGPALAFSCSTPSPVVVSETVDLVFSVHSERHTVKALVTDDTAETARVVRLSQSLQDL